MCNKDKLIKHSINSNNMAELIFGPGGNVGKDIFDSLCILKEEGLGVQEIEFVHSIVMKEDTARKAGQLAKELGIRLSIHAPYYVNLLSKEEHKIVASKKRILDCCRIGHILGAKSIVFHPAFYGDHSKEDAYPKVKEQVEDMMKTRKEEGLSPELCPETMGKGSQFGDIDEVLKLSRDTGCGVCIDFAHIYARNIGKIDYDDIFTKLKKSGLKQIHCHFSGIVYGEKGEKHHIQMEKERAEELLGYAKKYDVNLVVINESPDPFKGALDMKSIWASM